MVREDTVMPASTSGPVKLWRLTSEDDLWNDCDGKDDFKKINLRETLTEYLLMDYVLVGLLTELTVLPCFEGDHFRSSKDIAIYAFDIF